MLTALNRFDYNVIYPGPKQVHVNAYMFEMLTESTQRPLVAHIVMLLTLVLNKLIIFLVNAIVSQVDVLVVLANLVAVRFCCKSCQPLFINVNSQGLVASD